MRNGFINDEGFSLIEALVSIVLIGILSTLILSFIIKLSTGDKSLARMDALTMARTEIGNTITNRTINDTSYSDAKGKLTLFKYVTNKDSYFEINILVKNNKNVELVDIPVAIKKNEAN
jgi:prepilin-type N-terminal cleavage/methylation domain-containing protein